MADKPLSVSPFRAKPKIDRLAKDQANTASTPTPTPTPTSTTTHKPTYDASVQHHEDRSRDVRREVGKTLDEGRNQNVGAAQGNANGTAALMLKEKAGVGKAASESEDAARFDALAMLHTFRKETRGEGNPGRALVEIVQRAIVDGASPRVTANALDELPYALSSAHVQALLGQPALQKALQNAVVKDPFELFYTLVKTPVAGTAGEQLAALLRNPHFQTADADAQLSWLAGFRVRVNIAPESRKNLERFLASEAFTALPGQAKSVMYDVVSQTNGDAKVIDGLVRVAESASFQAMDLATQMSFASVVGATLRIIRTGTELQQTVLRNSLERLLEPNGIRVKLEALRPSTIGCADVDGRSISLNKDFKLNDLEKVDHLATHTLAHEVNHILNEPNEIAPPYERFMGEYRAWCVGFVAEKGRWPTRGEGAERIDHLLDVDAGYKDIARAALGSDADGKSIRRFAALFAEGSRTDEAPRPDPPGDLLNAG